MVRFRAGKHEGMSGRRWRAKGTGGEAQRSCGAPAGGRGQDKVGNGEAGGWACGGWSGGARGGLMPPVSRAARWVRIFSMSERARVASGTSRGVSMHAMTRNVPPHAPQCSMSMWKTRPSRCIQRMGAGRDAPRDVRSTARGGRCSGTGVRGRPVHGLRTRCRHGGRTSRAGRCRGCRAAGWSRRCEASGPPVAVPHGLHPSGPCAPRGGSARRAWGRSQGLRSLAEAADVPAGGLPGGRTTG